MKLKKPSPKMLRIFASVGMVAVFGLTVGSISMGASGFESQTAANEKAISTLQDDIKLLEGRKAESAADKNKDLYSASDAGRKVAELQMKYQDLDPVANPEGVKDNAKTLAGYFGDKDQLGRTPWFTITKGDAKVDWQFKSTYSAFESVVPVIWVCYPQGDAESLLGYVTASFHANDGKFHDVQRHLTTKSLSYSKAEGDDAKKALDALIDSINAQDIESDPLQSTEDLQSNSDGRAWLKDQYDKDKGGE
ncbi:MAG: hypothetical protein Q4B30_00855 [Coriobacteriaceae bacterium]|nr:hypothetical protein [Coriobacteriaceae bacterium]